jgi:hypothetical protein
LNTEHDRKVSVIERKSKDHKTCWYVRRIEKTGEEEEVEENEIRIPQLPFLVVSNRSID